MIVQRNRGRVHLTGPDPVRVMVMDECAISPSCLIEVGTNKRTELAVIMSVLQQLQSSPA